MSRTRFPKYDHYKDYGVEWLGEIPAHWEVLLVKMCVISSAPTKRRIEYMRS